MKTDSDDQQPDILDTPEQTKFKEEQITSELKKSKRILTWGCLASIFLTKDVIEWYKLYTVWKVKLIIIMR